LPYFAAKRRAALTNQFWQQAHEEQSVWRRLRRSIPFLLAIFFGMIAGVLVAGVAILAAHP
jgi:delta 1-pyrroline-5-carboxylate dehydrogenase